MKLNLTATRLYSKICTSASARTNEVETAYNTIHSLVQVQELKKYFVALHTWEHSGLENTEEKTGRKLCANCKRSDPSQKVLLKRKL